MKLRTRPASALRRKAKRGFRGFPAGTVALYGPTADLATKAAVGIIPSDGAEPSVLKRWFSEGETDIRHNAEIEREIVAFLVDHGARTVVMTGRVFGCPHEEGVDYPIGQSCPQCPYWAGRDRFTGTKQH